MSAVLHDLRANLTLTRDVYGRGASQTQGAFEMLVRAAATNGTPLDGLRRHTENEIERFFSFTIPGVDGHVYWDGPKDFRRNDGKYRRPLRWWWQHRYRNLDPSDDLVVRCGEPNCINPEHAAKERVRGTALRWSETRIIGVLQVAASRIGHSPTEAEFTSLGIGPSTKWIHRRFGGWIAALTAAGLPPSAVTEFDRTEVLRGIQLVRRLFGRWPSENDYRRYSKELMEARLPATKQAAVRLYGSFVAARAAAGGPSAEPGTRRATGGSGSEGYSVEQCLTAIRFVRDRLGRWPSMAELAREGEALAAEGLPSGETPFRRLFGSFTAARVAAGGVASVRSEEHLRPPHVKRTSREDVLAGILFVRDRIGRWPSQIEYRAESEALRAMGLPMSWLPAYKVFGSFTAARVAAGGPALLGGRSIRQETGEDASATEGTVT